MAPTISRMAKRHNVIGRMVVQTCRKCSSIQKWFTATSNIIMQLMTRMPNGIVQSALRLCGQLSGGPIESFVSCFQSQMSIFLAVSYFTGQNSDSMLDFQKHLSFMLIENAYMREEDRLEHYRSARIREGISHGLVSLPPWKFFCVDVSSLLCPNTRRKNAASATVKYEPIVYALLECPCAAIALQVTSMIAKRILSSKLIHCLLQCHQRLPS